MSSVCIIAFTMTFSNESSVIEPTEAPMVSCSIVLEIVPDEMSVLRTSNCASVFTINLPCLVGGSIVGDVLRFITFQVRYGIAALVQNGRLSSRRC